MIKQKLKASLRSDEWESSCENQSGPSSYNINCNWWSSDQCCCCFIFRDNWMKSPSSLLQDSCWSVSTFAYLTQHHGLRSQHQGLRSEQPFIEQDLECKNVWCHPAPQSNKYLLYDKLLLGQGAARIILSYQEIFLAKQHSSANCVTLDHLCW